MVNELLGVCPDPVTTQITYILLANELREITFIF